MILSTGATAISGGDGSYSITVDCGWWGTLTAIKTGWQFTPPFVVFAEPFAENQEENFAGTASTTDYKISGKVTDASGRVGMDGVAISFYDGITEHSETTAGGGYYSYTVPVFWTGAVTPTLAGYSFIPVTVNVGPVQADTAQDFIADANTYTISGTVVDSQAKPIAAVTMTLSTGAVAVTNTSGHYEFEVIHGWAGNLTPTKTGWKFNPAYRNYNGMAYDLIDEHFFGIKVKDQYTISGTVTNAGAALAGVVMSGLPGNPASDTAGFYSGAVTKGWAGTVKPTLPGYAFKPADRNYTDVRDNYANENYEALVNEPPLLEIVSPQDNAFVSGEVQIETEASDSDGIDKVEIYIDDQKVAEYSNIQAKADKLDPRDLAGVSANNLPALQVDGYGNTYSLERGKDGKTALVKQNGPGCSETLLKGDMSISGWLVQTGGAVIVAGTTNKTGERWLKSLLPNKEIPGMPVFWLAIEWKSALSGPEEGEAAIADFGFTAANAKFTCKYFWDTSLFDLGTHTIMARAFDTKELSAEDEIKATISSMTMQLQLERKTERAWIIGKEYVKIDAIVENPGSIPISKYIIYRKWASGEYAPINEVPASDVQGNSFTYNDQGIENNKTYTYRIEAVDENGVSVGGSEEETI
jgi:hypothetical protein